MPSKRRPSGWQELSRTRKSAKTKTTKPKSKTRTKKVVEVDVPCVHHWIIDSANGPTSEGRCKKCHVTKLFANSVWSTPDTWQIGDLSRPSPYAQEMQENK